MPSLTPGVGGKSAEPPSILSVDSAKLLIGRAPPWSPSSARGRPFVPSGDIPGTFARLTPPGFVAPQGQPLKAELPYKADSPTSVDRQAHAVIKDALTKAVPPPGLRLAREYLLHYLSNKGTPVVVSPSEVLRMGKSFVSGGGGVSRVTHHDPKDEIVAEVRKAARMSPSGTIKGLTRWITVQDEKSFETLGHHSMKLSYIADYKRLPSGELAISVKAVAYVQDVYDFERNGKMLPVQVRASDLAPLPAEYRKRWGSLSGGVGIAISVPTVQDNLFAELQLRGLAKPFAVVGASPVFSFSIMDAGGQGARLIMK